tara:strand:+ start:794 stop:1144 length:351 start_codon:yes stop_codon:yes gene_type:complete
MSKEISYNTKRIKAFIGDNPGVMRKMVDIFLTNAPKMLAEIHKSYEKKDYTNLNFYAHKLKSSIYNFNIEEIENDIRLIERYAKERKSLEELPALIERVDHYLNIILEKVRKDFNA